MQDEFVSAILSNQAAFGLTLGDDVITRLSDFYRVVLEHNPVLHLVGPCTPTEFATRHILESLTLLKHLPQRVKFADIGPGAGLPSIPCLVARNDLASMLIESKEKKANFLQLAVDSLGLASRAEIVHKQFAETVATGCEYVTCRALDRFTEVLPRLTKWSGRRRMLLFGGPTLEAALMQMRCGFASELMPMSKQRCLFVLDR